MAEKKSFLAKNGAWMAPVLLVGAGVIGYFTLHQGGYHPPTNAYFVDEDTGEELVRPATDVPPLQGKGGKMTVVREFKYSVDGGKTSKVAYYFKYNDSTKSKLEEANKSGKAGEMDANPGELVRATASGSKWVSLGSEEGSRVTQIDVPANADVRVMTP